MRAISLTGFLFAFWLALSGHYTPMLLAAGAASALLCVAAALRMRIVDTEGQPVELGIGLVTYLPWLAGEVAKSAWAVTKIILDPRLPIAPTMTIVRGSQRTSVGLAVYGNSITLTPGTITVAQRGNELTVHALTGSGARELETGAMDRRVTRLEGSG
jgi:multicomponent Na+:H+ antiporter subunit E